MSSVFQPSSDVNCQQARNQGGWRKNVPLEKRAGNSIITINVLEIVLLQSTINYSYNKLFETINCNEESQHQNPT